MCVSDTEQDPVTQRVASAVKANIRSFIILRLELDKRHLGVIVFTAPAMQLLTSNHLQTLAKLHNPFALVTASALHPILTAENISLRKKMHIYNPPAYPNTPNPARKTFAK